MGNAQSAKAVLLTGAAGRVGRVLAPLLAQTREMRTTDRSPGDGSAALVGDLTDPGFAREALSGVEAVVHLAGEAAPNAEWSKLRRANIDLTVSVLGAVLAAGVQRVVLASSVHAAGAYVHEQKVPVGPEWPPSPCCPYGATKAWMEAIGRTYAYQAGLSVISLRLGLAHKPPPYVRSLSMWLSPRDMAQLVARAIDVPTVTSGVYHGVSANTRQTFAIGNASAELGYDPEDDSERFATCVADDGGSSLCAPGSRLPIMI